MQLYPFVINGVTYTLPSFDAFAYITALPASMGDLVQEVLDIKVGTSSSSVAIATGAKSFTTQGGLNIKVGDSVIVASSAAPQTNRMYGTVSSYNFSTGSLNVNVLGINGSGTIASWVIALGGSPTAYIGDYIIGIDDGGLGYGRPTHNYPVNFLGAGDPSTNMEEIYEEFAGSQGALTAAGVNAVNLPWVAYNSPTTNAFSDPASTTVAAVLAGYNLISGLLPGLLMYSESGRIHLGRGALSYQTRLYGVSAGSKYVMKAGLSYSESTKFGTIFSGSGVGFEATTGLFNGKYCCICAASGAISRIATSVAPSASGDTLRFEVDHEGKTVDFFISEVYVGTISTNIPTYGPLSLLHPVYASIPYSTNSNTPTTQTNYWIDSIYVRKYLLR